MENPPKGADEPSKDGENPPKGGERDNRKIVKKVIGWLTLQALGAWLRHLIVKLFLDV
ncbi:hypothetical protein [Streptomyces sp. AMCC400023]|uniref:hypothetical protein n=1 Tax=Streptomyces sp. AMCC400023 TaxID=2056258 RepID=UPI001F2361F0|nr:hypothetical protein [Streptomyces sp. AMCC400023]